jgi:hypothetical protein
MIKKGLKPNESNALKGIELNPFTSLENEVISNGKRHEFNALKGSFFYSVIFCTED